MPYEYFLKCLKLMLTLSSTKTFSAHSRHDIDDEYSILYNTTQTQITKELYNVSFRCYSTSHEYEKT